MKEKILVNVFKNVIFGANICRFKWLCNNGYNNIDFTRDPVHH